ncbi:hypothetical protein [Parapedobacter composti]|nr:hypothetical protein [Parapedobacter composti]
MRLFAVFIFQLAMTWPCLRAAADYGAADTLHQTRSGKMVAPVIDIMPQLRVFHDLKAIEREISELKALGFQRVYFVLCNPGYPSFASPRLSVMPLYPDLRNDMLRSILCLGDPNWVYAKEAKRQGLEAWAIIKPYESGTGNTIPHNRHAALSLAHVPTVGGQHIGFDELLSANPQPAGEKETPFGEGGGMPV